MHRHSLVPTLLLLVTSLATTVVAVAVDVDTCESSDHDETCVAPVEETDLTNWKPVCAKEVVIPDGVTSIRSAAFAMCSSLASIVIPDSVTTIEKRAFYACTSLTSIVIPISVTTIEMSAFYECTSLTAFIFPDSVTSIGAMAFQRCTSLVSIVIPDSVMAIEARAFSLCSSLTTASEHRASPRARRSEITSSSTRRRMSRHGRRRRRRRLRRRRRRRRRRRSRLLRYCRGKIMARQRGRKCWRDAMQRVAMTWRRRPSAFRGRCGASARFHQVG